MNSICCALNLFSAPLIAQHQLHAAEDLHVLKLLVSAEVGGSGRDEGLFNLY